MGISRMAIYCLPTSFLILNILFDFSYSRTLVSFWRTVRKKGLWLSGYTMERWHISPLLHAHSSDAITQCFYCSLKSWRVRRKTDPNSKPPRRRRWYFKVIWKSTAIKIKDVHKSKVRSQKSLILTSSVSKRIQKMILFLFFSS